MLPGKGARSENRARVHQFPVNRDGLGFERPDIECFGIVDQREFAFRAHDRGNLRHVASAVVETRDKINLLDAQCQQLRGPGLAMIDDIVGAMRQYPIACLCP